jgi:hypothetical protein
MLSVSELRKTAFRNKNYTNSSAYPAVFGRMSSSIADVSRQINQKRLFKRMLRFFCFGTFGLDTSALSRSWAAKNYIWGRGIREKKERKGISYSNAK